MGQEPIFQMGLHEVKNKMLAFCILIWSFNERNTHSPCSFRWLEECISLMLCDWSLHVLASCWPRAALGVTPCSTQDRQSTTWLCITSRLAGVFRFLPSQRAHPAFYELSWLAQTQPWQSSFWWSQNQLIWGFDYTAKSLHLCHTV